MKTQTQTHPLPITIISLTCSQDNAQAFPILENYRLLNTGNPLDMFAPMFSTAHPITVKNAVEVLAGSITTSAVRGNP